MFALGGLMLPLSVYPGLLQKIASYTPFPAILGDRSALVLGFTVADALSVVVSLLLWGGAAALVFIFLYRKGLRILNVEGG